MKTHAASLAKQLKERQNNTKEVGSVLKGEGYAQRKPKYTSKPSVVQAEAAHQALHQVGLNPEPTKTFGK